MRPNRGLFQLVTLTLLCLMIYSYANSSENPKNAYISAIESNPIEIDHENRCLVALKYELTIVWAPDQTQYVQAVIDYGSSGVSTNIPQYPTIEKQIQTWQFDTNPIMVDVHYDLTQKYHWFRIRYIKVDGTENVGPWKFTTNPLTFETQINKLIVQKRLTII